MHLRGRRALRRTAGGTGLALLIPVLLLAGCGATNSDASAKTRLVSQANAICASALRSAASLKAPKSKSELVPFSERTSSIVSKLASELAGVKPPSSVRAAYDTFVKTVAGEARLLAQVVAALRTRSAARARQALQGLSASAVDEEAKGLGITECARTASAG
jgi:hypothetical protein